MKKGYISVLLRKLRLMHLADWIRYHLKRTVNRKLNKQFRKNNPSVKLPPDYLIYESFQIDYEKYYTDSLETAKWLLNHFEKHIALKNVTILDWGCGPGRIIRHFPDLLEGKECRFLGTDYNQKSIDWCAQNLTGIEFNKNSLQAQLPYENESVDIIYGISIFTHLSEKLHFEWYNELYRVLKPNGILFLTTHGEACKIKMTHYEVAEFDKNNLIVRGNVKEGHRTFCTYHPKGFMKNLFSNATILEHIEGELDPVTLVPAQDIWIIRK